jgi:hypothetical protein
MVQRETEAILNEFKKERRKTKYMPHRKITFSLKPTSELIGEAEKFFKKVCNFKICFQPRTNLCKGNQMIWPLDNGATMIV